MAAPNNVSLRDFYMSLCATYDPEDEDFMRFWSFKVQPWLQGRLSFLLVFGEGSLEVRHRVQNDLSASLIVGEDSAEDSMPSALEISEGLITTRTWAENYTIDFKAQLFKLYWGYILMFGERRPQIVPGMRRTLAPPFQPIRPTGFRLPKPENRKRYAGDPSDTELQLRPCNACQGL